MDSLRIVQNKCYIEQRWKAEVMKRTRTLPQKSSKHCYKPEGNKVAVLIIYIM